MKKLETIYLLQHLGVPKPIAVKFVEAIANEDTNKKLEQMLNEIKQYLDYGVVFVDIPIYLESLLYGVFFTYKLHYQFIDLHLIQSIINYKEQIETVKELIDDIVNTILEGVVIIIPPTIKSNSFIGLANLINSIVILKGKKAIFVGSYQETSRSRIINFEYVYKIIKKEGK